MGEPSVRISSKIFVDFDLSPEHSPLLVFRSLENDSTSSLGLEYGDYLVWKTDEVKHCIGYHVKDEYHYYEPCPGRAILEKGVQCAKCRHRDLLFPCMICDGSQCVNTNEMWKICERTTTSVYVTFFGDIMKVGVSKKDRLLKRWLEQGADYASEVAIAPNGLIAREIESIVSKNFEVTKSVRIQKKLKSLSTNNEKLFEDNTHNDDIIMKDFYSKAKDISEWIQQKYDRFAVTDPVITDLKRYYGQGLKGSPLPINPSRHLEGIYAGMKGALFCLEIQNRFHVFDIRTLQGRLSDIQLGSYQINTSASSPVPQKSITEFFV